MIGPLRSPGAPRRSPTGASRVLVITIIIIIIERSRDTHRRACCFADDDPMDMKAKLKVWAQAVALASSSRLRN